MEEHGHMETCNNKLAHPRRRSFHFKQVRCQSVQPSLSYECYTKKCGQTDGQMAFRLYIVDYIS